MSDIYKLEVYVPKENLEKLKNAIFDAGAGKMGNYDRCCWQTAGSSQFRPCEGSDPHIGEEGKVEKLEEYKLELVFPGELKDEVIGALKENHPYETPAFNYFKVETD